MQFRLGFIYLPFTFKNVSGVQNNRHVFDTHFLMESGKIPDMPASTAPIDTTAGIEIIKPAVIITILIFHPL